MAPRSSQRVGGPAVLLPAVPDNGLEALGMTLTEEDRDHLLVLAAYRNRIFRSPPPVRVDRGEILGAFPALNRLVEAVK